MEYRAIDQSKDLQHWKYIKRYKGSNGKWRYVYADKNTHKSINRAGRLKDLNQEAADERWEKTHSLETDPNEQYGGWKAAAKLSRENARFSSEEAAKYREKEARLIATNSVSYLTKQKITKAKKWLSDFVKPQTTITATTYVAGDPQHKTVTTYKR